MKKFIVFFLGIIFMFSLSSCIGCTEEDMDSFYEGFKDGYYGEDSDQDE